MTETLIERLPPVRGKYREQVDLSKTNWFQVGGKADVLFRPADAEDLCDFLQHKPEDIPVIVLGVGSNLLVRDGGVRGVVIRLGRAFTEIEVQGDKVTAGAGALSLHVARMAEQHGVAGLEFLSGIPGTIGGALKMNGGAYGSETADILVEARAVDPSGILHQLDKAAMGFSYRHSEVPEGWIFTQAIFQGQEEPVETITQRMKEITEQRETTQPIRTRTSGSTFKNPDPTLSGGKKAWQLIDEAGCRGLQIGGAKISELHCNFLINTGNATATDIETLGETVRQRVKEDSGIELEWEIERIGDKV